VYRWLSRLDVDYAVLFGILTRVWRLGAGPVTLLLIAARFTPELQGYYYTFYNLLALQIFVELGLGTVVVQFASHEWARLELDEQGRLVGDPKALSRLASLAQESLRWYARVAGIAAVSLGLGGWVFFSRKATTGIEWLGPWLALCAYTALQLLLVPLWSLLEGCNQVVHTYFFRFVQSVVNSVALWLALLLGAELWTGPLAGAAVLAWAALFLRWRYRRFLRTLRDPVQGPRIHWRTEIWPMQWRIALTWLSGYLIFSLFTPVLFYFHGPALAGQMGMTWSLIDTLSMTAFTFVATKVPRFGMLIARREYQKLDHLFFRSLLLAMIVACVGASLIWAGVYGLDAAAHPLAERLLKPTPTGLFLVATVLNQITFAMAVYLRAHKREPYLTILVAGALLATVFTLTLGRQFGAVGVGAGFLVVNSLILVPAVMIFLRRRDKWHAWPAESLAK
jgi:O-antigen/teichoic acid export membrane protein